MMTYAVGMLNIGIVIGAILHVDKKIFINIKNIKNNNNILKFYKALEYFSENTNCDLVITYNAYRTWFNKFGIKLIPNIKQKKLCKLSKKEKKEEEIFCEEYQLNHGILIEILKNINDFKLRLIKLDVYRKNESNEENLEIPSQLPKIPNYDVFKYIMYGAFYKNLFLAEYENPNEINKLIISQASNINQNEILRFPLASNKNIQEGLLKSIFMNEGLFETKTCDICLMKAIQGTHQLLVHYKDIKETKIILKILKNLTMNSSGSYYYKKNNDKEKVDIKKPECASLLKYYHYFKEKNEIL